MVYIRFASHRARTYALRMLERKPDAFYSTKRNSFPGGIYAVTEAEIAALRQCAHAKRFTRVRGPHDDLMKCWG